MNDTIDRTIEPNIDENTPINVDKIELLNEGIINIP